MNSVWFASTFEWLYLFKYFVETSLDYVVLGLVKNTPQVSLFRVMVGSVTPSRASRRVGEGLWRSRSTAKPGQTARGRWWADEASLRTLCLQLRSWTHTDGIVRQSCWRTTPWRVTMCLKLTLTQQRCFEFRHFWPNNWLNCKTGNRGIPVQGCWIGANFAVLVCRH